MSDLADALAPTGTLRAVINLGNPVLAQGTPDAPSGMTVDIATDLASWLDVPLALTCVGAAKDSYALLVAGDVDVAFLADEPKRREGAAFTSPYLTIEGVVAVPTDSPITSSDDVDRDGVRIAVKEGSAYDLYLSRTLRHAEVVRGAEAVDVLGDDVPVLAGIRQPVTTLAAELGLRVLEPSIMEIRQCVALPLDADPAAVEAVSARVSARAAG